MGDIYGILTDTAYTFVPHMHKNSDRGEPIVGVCMD